MQLVEERFAITFLYDRIYNNKIKLVPSQIKCAKIVPPELQQPVTVAICSNE